MRHIGPAAPFQPIDPNEEITFHYYGTNGAMYSLLINRTWVAIINDLIKYNCRISAIKLVRELAAKDNLAVPGLKDTKDFVESL